MKELLKKLPATDAPADSTTEAAEAGRAPEPIGDPQSAGSGQPSTDGSPPSAVGGDPRAVEQGERSAPKRAVAGVLEFRILANPETKAPSFEEYHQRLRRGSVRPRYGVDPYGWFEIAEPVRFFGAKDPDGLTRDFEKLREKAKAIVGRHGGKYYVLAHLDWEHALVRPGLNRWRVQQARVLKNPRDQSPAIGVTLDSPGAVRLGELHKHRGRVLAVLLDDRVISHFTIDSPLKKELVIGGLGSREEASRIVSKLNAFAESATTQPAVRPPDSRPPSRARR